MVVVKICMWPRGDRSKERVLSVGALDLVGQANADRPDVGVRKGERMYRIRLFKDTAFGGPDGASSLSRAPVWRSGHVRGHLPGPRGVWDLLGGALQVLCGPRLKGYVAVEAAPGLPPMEEDTP